MNLTKYILLISFLMLPCFILAQQSSEQNIKAIESKLLTVPSAPYKLKATSDGSGYEFCNTSSVGIVRFRLGCVQKKKDELNILEQRPFIEHSLPASGEAITCFSRISTHGFFPDDECKKGKLALTEVVFDNGDGWKLIP